MSLTLVCLVSREYALIERHRYKAALGLAGKAKSLYCCSHSGYHISSFLRLVLLPRPAWCIDPRLPSVPPNSHVREPEGGTRFLLRFHYNMSSDCLLRG